MYNGVKEAFNTFFKGEKNFMTPDVIRYGVKRQYMYELSRGEGFDGNTIYGVTVLENTPQGVKRPEGDEDMSECFHTLEECEARIQGLDKRERTEGGYLK